MQFNELLGMDMTEINIVIDVLINRREYEINTTKALNHELSILISKAVWGSKDFPDKVQFVRLTEESEEEKLDNLREQMKANFRVLGENSKKGGR